MCPEIVQAALAAQYFPQQHNNPNTLWCELGFLFHMMKSIEEAGGSNTKGKTVTPANFQKIFQQIPEAIALGLVEAELEQGRGDTQHTTQVEFLQHRSYGTHVFDRCARPASGFYFLNCKKKRGVIEAANWLVVERADRDRYQDKRIGHPLIWFHRSRKVQSFKSLH